MAKDEGIQPSGNIFISYRRADSGDIAGRVYERLVEAFGKFPTVEIFKDVYSIPLGVNFKDFLDQKVGECKVMLALIGDHWVEDATGKRRLEDQGDFVRAEIESALDKKIPVIPLLVRNASMPKQEQLPDGLKRLAFMNGTPIRLDPDFDWDMERLIVRLSEMLAREGPSPSGEGDGQESSSEPSK